MIANFPLWYKTVLAILTLTAALALAESDIVRRQWTLPELTPVIDTSGEPDKSDPFASGQDL